MLTIIVPLALLASTSVQAVKKDSTRPAILSPIINEQEENNEWQMFELSENAQLFLASSVSLFHKILLHLEQVISLNELMLVRLDNDRTIAWSCYKEYILSITQAVDGNLSNRMMAALKAAAFVKTVQKLNWKTLQLLKQHLFLESQQQQDALQLLYQECNLFFTNLSKLKQHIKEGDSLAQEELLPDLHSSLYRIQKCLLQSRSLLEDDRHETANFETSSQSRLLTSLFQKMFNCTRRKHR